MCIRDLLILGMEKLIEYNIDEYTLKAKMLLCDILKVKKEYFTYIIAYILIENYTFRSYSVC